VTAGWRGGSGAVRKTAGPSRETLVRTRAMARCIHGRTVAPQGPGTVAHYFGPASTNATIALA
jgi:hypothetical protein